MTDSVECLKTVNNNLELSWSHQYFYQVQCQMLVTGKGFCDFIVWTEKDMFVERISIDTTIREQIVMKSKNFFKAVILPELVGKFYSRPLQDKNPSAATTASTNSQQDGTKLIICTCQKEYNEDSDNVIGCDNEKWLHFECANIKRVPKGKWMCKYCRKDNAA